MPTHDGRLPFPLIRNLEATGLRPRAGTLIQLEASTDSLPHGLDLVLHVSWQKDGQWQHLETLFVSTLHPAYVYGKKGDSDRFLARLMRDSSAAVRASEKLAASSTLRIDCPHPQFLAAFVAFSLCVGQDRELRGIMVPFGNLAHAFEAATNGTPTRIPEAKRSNARKKASPEVNSQAQGIFHGPKPKQRKAG